MILAPMVLFFFSLPNSDLFSRRFRGGISFLNFVKRSIPKLPLSEVSAVPLSLQNRAFSSGKKGEEEGWLTRSYKTNLRKVCNTTSKVKDGTKGSFVGIILQSAVPMLFCEDLHLLSGVRSGCSENQQEPAKICAKLLIGLFVPLSSRSCFEVETCVETNFAGKRDNLP